MQTKFKITDEIEHLFLENYHEIAGNQKSFTISDFIKAKQKNPKLLSIVENFDINLKS